ncbi:MAG TPA: transketolase C-terminal domain-containing protein [Longimicrobium sp.]|nr:transketolase C-terminal domain-containing protein [Longimicrobium sp.]
MAETGYGEILLHAGRAHPQVLVLDAGLATSMRTHRFAAEFPERYFNLGIAEQNAVGVAGGLARRGFVPLLHTFSNFVARRAHDQLALSVAWPGCAVGVVAGSCGVFDGRNGPSHMATDDLAAVSALPGMWVAEPGDLRQTEALLDRLVRLGGPGYLRLRRFGAPADLLGEDLPPGGTVLVRARDDARCTLVACGSMLEEVLHAHALLKERGIPADVVHAAVLKPLDPAPILASAARTGLLVTVENHVAAGGWGDAVARHAGPRGIPHLRLALPDAYVPAGDPAWQLAWCGLDAGRVAARAAAAAERLHPPERIHA